jgi:hypothetical protein
VLFCAISCYFILLFVLFSKKRLKIIFKWYSAIYYPFVVSLNMLQIDALLVICVFELSILHSGSSIPDNAMLIAWAFTISYIKCLKRGLLKEFWGPFRFFCMECHGPLDPSPLLSVIVQKCSFAQKIASKKLFLFFLSETFTNRLIN